MRGGQIASLIIAIILLLPGGCFMLFGIGLSTDNEDNMSGLGWSMLGIAVVILGFSGLLFWLAFRKSAGGAGQAGTPPPTAS